jgi:DNA-binding HxlR family transcriptional regulator
MPDYGRYCPVALASEVVADRWTPLILRELILGNTRFNDIARGMPGISRSLLVQRLRHLERRGVVETWPSPTGKGNEYHLTAAGKDLERVIDSLGRWAIEWLFDELRPHDVDPVTLTWWMHRRIASDRLPPVRTVVEFRHVGAEQEMIWLVLERGEASVCIQHPGYDVNLLVTTTTADLADVFQGYSRWADSVRDGRITVDGPPRLVRDLPKWFQWSPWVEVTHERAHRLGTTPAET